MTVEVKSAAAEAEKPAAPEKQPAEPKDDRVLVQMLRPNRYRVRGQTYERSKVYRVSPQLRDYLCGLDDGRGGLARHFVDYVPPAAPGAPPRPLFVPMTEQGSRELAERQSADSQTYAKPEDFATPVAPSELGTFDTAMERTGRRPRDPAQAQALLGRRRVPV